MIVGILLRLNTLLVVTVSGFLAGIIADMTSQDILIILGKSFLDNRNITFIMLLPLAIIGLLERHGLEDCARSWIAQIKSATAGRLLIVYLFLRETTAALGLNSLGGHTQMVKPLLAPMVEATTERRYGMINKNIRYRLYAMSAATDNIGLFFGEDIFVAFGAVVLMQRTLQNLSVNVKTYEIALWGLPTALCAFFIHATRLVLLDKAILSQSGKSKGDRSEKFKEKR
jgi:uncharacterized membrane protein